MSNRTGFKPSWEEIAAYLTTTPGNFDFFLDMAAEAMKNEYRREEIVPMVSAMVKLTGGRNPLDALHSCDKKDRLGIELMLGFAQLGQLIFAATLEYTALNECEQQDSTVNFLQQTGYLMSKDVSAISNEELSNRITGLHMGEPA